MKVTPVAAGTIATETLGKTSPERLEAAKAAFSGETPVSLKPSDTPIDPQVARAQESIRKIKMRTNVTPESNFVPTHNAILDTTVEQPAQDVTKPIDPQLAALAKAKRAIQVKEMEIKRREEALALQPKSDVVERLKSDPLSVLRENGITYDQLTDAILKDGQQFDPKALRAEIKEELKKEFTQEFTTRDELAEQQVLKSIQYEADQLVKQGDEFEGIRETGQTKEITNLIHTVYKKGWPDKQLEPGYIMSVEEAAPYVEAQIVEDAKPLTKLKKIQNLFQPAPVTPQPRTQQMRTLTNRDSTAAPMTAKQRAIAAFNGTLRKG